jgi:hypothetical protein
VRELEVTFQVLEESGAYVHGGKTTPTSNRYLQNQEKEAHVASSGVRTKDNSLHKVILALVAINCKMMGWQ